MNDTRAKMHPPEVAVGAGGPDPTPLDEKTRAERDAVRSELTRLRAQRSAAKPEDRERLDKEVSDRQAKVRELSETILRNERKRESGTLQ